MFNDVNLLKVLADDIKTKIDEEKKKSIDELDNINDEYTWVYKNLFNSVKGYETIGDILMVDEDLLDRKFYSHPIASFAVMSRTELLLRDFLRDKGLLFKFEYEKLGVSEEVAAVKLSDLEHFPQDVLNILEGRKVEKELRIVDLLNMKFENLCRILGDEKVVTLKNYLHELGIKFRDEKVLFIEVNDSYNKDCIFIKDVFGDAYTVNLLHKYEIFTLDELVAFGDDIFKLDGIGAKRRNNILYVMNKFGYKFNMDCVTEDNDIEFIRSQNESLKKKIFEFEQKIDEKDALLIERKYLLEREKELDRIINSKVNLDNLNENEYIK